jgi:AraC-like DNA-binding protein
MELHFRRPGPPLDRHVELITFFSGLDAAHQREKLIPDGAIDLVVDLGETPKKLYASESSSAAVDFRRAWISGMQRHFIVIEAQPASSLLVIRFRPGGAYGVIGHDAGSLTDGVFALEDLLGSFATSLRERVLEAPTAELRIAAAKGWLLERIGAVALPSVLVHLLGRLEDPRGIRIRDLADEAGISERHMLQLFRRFVGVSPKQYARIRRFQGVLSRVAAPAPADLGRRTAPLQPPDWAETAAVSGYADQAHLTHEFRAFTGMTPGEYSAAYRGLTNYLPITLRG